MANTVQFIGTIKNGKCRLQSGMGISTSRSNPSGATETCLLYTSGVSGGRIDNISIRSAGAISVATTANVLRFWYQPSGSTSFYLLREVAVATSTPSATAAGYSSDITALNWVLSAGDKIYCSMHAATAATADIYDIITIFGGDY